MPGRGSSDDAAMRVAIDLPRPSDSARGVVVTGHQAWLWHPGILTKYLLAASYAKKNSGGHSEGEGPSGGWRHLVVDHAVYHPWALDLPFQNGDRLFVKRFYASAPRVGVSASAYAPVDGGRVADRLLAWVKGVGGRALFDAHALCEAWRRVPALDRLVDQAGCLIGQAAGPLIEGRGGSEVGARTAWPEHIPTLGGVSERLLELLFHDPWRAAHLFNQALFEHPGSGLNQLHAGVDLVELPLWYVGRAGIRERVFAQVGGGRFACVTGRGQTLNVTEDSTLEHMAPRAAMLTAWMRSEPSTALFIHGTGGGVYDQVTEAWCRRWLETELAPMAVATADVCLPFDAPIHTADEHERAVWAAHHAPFNVDRVAELSGDLVDRKRVLIARMDDDRDAKRRRVAFDEIHTINAHLRERHVDVLEQAAQRVAQTSAGVANQAIAQRRDWFFGLYPREVLESLAQQIEYGPAVDGHLALDTGV